MFKLWFLCWGTATLVILSSRADHVQAKQGMNRGQQPIVALLMEKLISM